MTSAVDTPFNATLVGYLREMRLARQITQRDLAAKLGKPNSYVAKVETLQRGLSVEEFVSWSNALGEDPALLLTLTCKAARRRSNSGPRNE